MKNTQTDSDCRARADRAEDSRRPGAGTTPCKEYDVIVIGGGATGAGTARDCAMRGLKTILIERLDFTAGATGRNHGLLHSGARYAHTDPESAAECIKENMILRRIARHCVEDTGGLFVTLPEDSLDYQEQFVKDCAKAGISADVLDPKEALRLEPAVNPDLIGAVRVPDGSVDPFRLTTANVLSARMHGPDILPPQTAQQPRRIGDKCLRPRDRQRLRHLGPSRGRARRSARQHVSRQRCPAHLRPPR